VPELTVELIRAARERIRDKVTRTPVLTNDQLDARSGGSLFFKAENLQKIGAFKARGATNAIFMLSDEEARRGVVTHSSGNHGAAVARAAHLRGIPAYVVMPTTVPQVKQASVRRFGARITFCEPTIPSREATTKKVIDETGAQLIHPYNDVRVMAGQGTAALELLEDAPGLDIVMCPVGGGGLVSGTAVAAKGVKPGIRVVAVEPAGADDAYRSFKSGKLVTDGTAHTIADGLRGRLGDKTFPEIRAHVDDIVTVSEESIVQAMRSLWETLKVVVEPSDAVPYAAILERKLDVAGKRVGIILTGGNLDLDSLPWSGGEVL
jgi:threonine dehydratase